MRTPKIDLGWWLTGTSDGRAMRDVLAGRDIEAVFQFLRRHGISRTRIAALTGLSETRVRLISQGKQQVCSYEVLERIADGLAIPRHYMGLGYAPDEGDTSRGQTLVDPDTPTSLRHMLSVLARTSDTGKLPSLRPAVHTQLRLMSAMRAGSTGKTHRQFLATEASWWEFLSWIEDNDAALAEVDALDTALRLSSEASDGALTGYVLMRQSQRAIDHLDHPRAIGYARQAQRHAELPPRVRALAAIREAEALALSGDAALSRTKTDEAMKLVTGSIHDDPISDHCTPAYIAAHEAHCRLLLGEPAQAAAAYQSALSDTSPRSLLDEGLWRAQLAIAHAQNGSPELASHDASAALDLAIRTESARITRTIDKAARTLRHYPGVPEADQFTARYNQLRGKPMQGLTPWS